jgi:hypothetical protein
MLYNLIFELLLMAGLGLIVYIFASALPRLEDEPADRREGRLEKLFKRIPFDEIDDYLNFWGQKMLRRFKILLMKADNAVTASLDKLSKRGKDNKKQGNGNGLPTA